MEKYFVTTKKVHLSYERALPVRKKELRDNDFCRVLLSDSAGNEIADLHLSSLPGFHHSNVDEIEKVINRFFSQAILQISHIDFSKKYFNMVVRHSFAENLSGEMLFHIESLLFFIVKKIYPEKVKLSGPVHQNGLYHEKSKLEELALFHCLKWKISPATDTVKIADKIHELRKLNPHQLQRFDGNRQFELQEFITFMKKIQKRLPDLVNLLDYIEEPFKDPFDLAWARKLTPFTFALDESFMSYYQTAQLDKIPKGLPLVLKPSLLGLSTTIYLVEKFADSRIIISSAFEHPDLKEVLHFMAAYKPWEYHGLTLGNTLV